MYRNFLDADDESVQIRSSNPNETRNFIGEYLGKNRSITSSES